MLIILKKFDSIVACIENEQSFSAIKKELCSYDYKFLNTDEGNIRVWRAFEISLASDLTWTFFSDTSAPFSFLLFNDSEEPS